ncbi:MAG: hypothetical protein V3S68_01670, partial [Dehalococcoidia bacterium]
MELFSARRLLILGAALFAIGCSSSAATPLPGATGIDGLPAPTPTPVVAPAPAGSTGGTLTL